MVGGSSRVVHAHFVAWSGNKMCHMAKRVTAVVATEYDGGEMREATNKVCLT